MNEEIVKRVRAQRLASEFAKKVQTSLDDLFAMMQTGELAMVTNHDGKQYVGRIVSIALEDGSGKCWNVGIQCASIAMSMFTRFN